MQEDVTADVLIGKNRNNNRKKNKMVKQNNLGFHFKLH